MVQENKQVTVVVEGRALPTAFAYPKDIVAFHSSLVQETAKELEEAKKIKQKLEEVPIESSAGRGLLKRMEGRIAFLEKRLAALENAFLPIPRFDYVRFRYAVDSLPYPIASRLVEAEQLGVFSEIGLVEGRRRPTSRRDPILIGVIKQGHREEHFLIGWWR
jgi:hypothetical protein